MACNNPWQQRPASHAPLSPTCPASASARHHIPDSIEFEYILQITCAFSLSYVGFTGSQGTAQAFAALSIRTNGQRLIPEVLFNPDLPALL